MGHSRGTVTALAAAGGSAPWSAPTTPVTVQCLPTQPVDGLCWPLQREPRVKAIMGMAIGAQPIIRGVDLDKITVPTLLVAGQEDDNSLPAASTFAHDRDHRDDRHSPQHSPRTAGCDPPQFRLDLLRAAAVGRRGLRHRPRRGRQCVRGRQPGRAPRPPDLRPPDGRADRGLSARLSLRQGSALLRRAVPHLPGEHRAAGRGHPERGVRLHRRHLRRDPAHLRAVHHDVRDHDHHRPLHRPRHRPGQAADDRAGSGVLRPKARTRRRRGAGRRGQLSRHRQRRPGRRRLQTGPATPATPRRTARRRRRWPSPRTSPPTRPAPPARPSRSRPRQPTTSIRLPPSSAHRPPAACSRSATLRSDASRPTPAATRRTRASWSPCSAPTSRSRN